MKKREREKKEEEIKYREKKKKQTDEKRYKSLAIEHRYPRMVPRYFRFSTMQLITVIRAFTYTDKNQTDTVCPVKRTAYYRQTPVLSMYNANKNSNFREKEFLRLENEPYLNP